MRNSLLAIFFFLLGTALANAESLSRERAATAKAECDAYASTIDNSHVEGKLQPKGRRRPPKYPEDAEMLELFACNAVKFDIDESGRPHQIEIVFRSPGDMSVRFDEASIDAVMDWRYKAIGEIPKGGFQDIVTYMHFELVE